MSPFQLSPQLSRDTQKKHIICGNGITFVPLHHKKTRNNRHYDTRRTDKNDQ
jgi:hypothetical protein